MMKIDLDDVKIKANIAESVVRAFGKLTEELLNKELKVAKNEFAVVDKNGDLIIKAEMSDGRTFDVYKIDFADWEYLTEDEKRELRLL